MFQLIKRKILKVGPPYLILCFNEEWRFVNIVGSVLTSNNKGCLCSLLFLRNQYSSLLLPPELFECVLEKHILKCHHVILDTKFLIHFLI